MAAQGRNEGFYVLDEFVCEAIHAPSVPRASPANQGRNEGMSVVEELLFDAGQGKSSNGPAVPDGRKPTLPDPQGAALRSVVEPLALYISASGDPRGALALALELLLAKLQSI